MENAIYRNKRVLLTGDTGFKGAWLGYWLHLLGAEVLGVALPPENDEFLFARAGLSSVWEHHDVDIRCLDRVCSLVRDFKPDVVFHLAAQALVRESYATPVETLATNVMGTAHVLEALSRWGGGCSVVVVTSDKCYENREWIYAYRENDAMGGHDVYSASKGCAELVCASYRRAFFEGSGTIRLASARAGNVIGPGDWAEDRIVPDALRAFYKSAVLQVRRPHAVRPWQHVLEPLAGYLRLGQCLMGASGEAYTEGWNFGPFPGNARSVGELITKVREMFPGSQAQLNDDKRGPHEANFLRLSIDKTVSCLGWEPVWSFDETVRRTVEGYRSLMAAMDEGERQVVMKNEIEEYERKRGELKS